MTALRLDVWNHDLTMVPGVNSVDVTASQRVDIPGRQSAPRWGWRRTAVMFGVFTY